VFNAERIISSSIYVTHCTGREPKLTPNAANTCIALWVKDVFPLAVWSKNPGKERGRYIRHGHRRHVVFFFVPVVCSVP